MRAIEEGSQRSDVSSTKLNWKIILHPILWYFPFVICLSAIVVVIASLTTNNTHVYLLVGSILSLVGTSLILLCRCSANADHLRKYHLIYMMTICSFFFAVKMFFTATMVLTGHGLEWQEKNTAICYFSALLGHFSFMGMMGYCFTILLDVAFIVCAPTLQASRVSLLSTCYHITVWSVAILLSLPPLISGAVGVNVHGTCYFTGVYGSLFLCCEGVFLLGSVAACVWVYQHQQQLDSMQNPLNSRLQNRIAKYQNVIKRSILAFCAFIFAASWNFVYHVISYFNNDPPPHWLNAVQLFWFGGLGFCTAIVWYPFIKSSLLQVGEEIIERMSPRRKEIKVVRRIDYLQSASSGASGADTDVGNVSTEGVPPLLPIYRIPTRWHQETLNPYSEDDLI